MNRAFFPLQPLAWAPRVVVALPVALGLVLAGLWIRPNVRWQPPEALRPNLNRPGGGLVLEAMQPPNASQYTAMLERPLFSPSRRSQPAQPVDKTRADSPAPDLLGTTRIYGIFAAGGAVGILADVGGKPRRIPIGGMLGDWRIVSIVDRDITFARNADTRVIKLLRAKPGVPGEGFFKPGGVRPANMQWNSGSHAGYGTGSPQ